MLHHYLPEVSALTGMGTTRIAIWNRNKIVSAFVIGTWLTNVGFLFHSKYLLLIQWNWISHESGWLPGIVNVSYLFQLFVFETPGLI